MATKKFACAPKPAPLAQQDVGKAITGQAARSASAPPDAKIKAVNISVSLVRQVERKVINLNDRSLKTNFSNFVDVALRRMIEDPDLPRRSSVTASTPGMANDRR